jgi:serine/threonine protein kinase
MFCLQGVDFKAMFPDANPQAIDLMSKMLKFDPEDRIDVNAALAHPWLAQLHDCTAEPSHPSHIEFGFEDDNLTGEQVRERLYNEIKSHFHPTLP